MKALCVFGANQYGDPARESSPERRAFLPALRRAGYDVLHFDSWDKSRYRDLPELNTRLLETVERERPDVLLFVPLLAEVWLETLQIIRRRGDVVTICWTTDDSWKYQQQSRYLAPAFHAITTTYPDVLARYHADGHHNVILTQWAASFDELAEPLPASRCRYPVTFVGSMHGGRRERVDRLRNGGLDVRCFGLGSENGPVTTEQMRDIFRESVISLNFANSQGSNQIKARTFEVPGAGGFLLSESAAGLELFYVPDQEIVLYGDDAELQSKAAWFLAHPAERDAVAQRGHLRTRNDHTYDIRLREVIAFAREQKAAGPVLPATGTLDAALRAHGIGPAHRLLRSALVTLASAVVGRRRARKAARRLVYELSWRFRGAATYSSAGLPGRLFPRD